MKKFLFLIVFSILIISCSSEKSNLPNLNSFSLNPTDQFPVSIDETVYQTQPARGQGHNNPHLGIHVLYADENKKWTKLYDNSIPSDYPPVYAIADGKIHSVIKKKEIKTPQNYHHGYEINLIFAKDDNNEEIFANYSIEPFIEEPVDSFYENFILVDEGQGVSKGDILAYFFVPPNASYEALKGKNEATTHLHFHIGNLKRNTFISPSIFNEKIREEFSKYIGGYYGSDKSGKKYIGCFGVKIESFENPFSNQALDCS
ncbi:MAG: hypothetical protein ACJ0G8_06150 [Dehalococcoidia bacterium]